MRLGLDKLFIYLYLLFYSPILKIFTDDSFQVTHYFFILFIILPQSGQNDLHILHLYTLAKQLSLKKHIRWWEIIIFINGQKPLFLVIMWLNNLVEGILQCT